MKRNGKFLKVMGMFLGLVLFLTFFSKTIYNFNLPTVTAVMPAGGILVDKVEKDALITYSNISFIYAELSGKIKNVLITEGQEVKRGQRIIEFYRDEEAIEDIKMQMQIKKQDIELLNLKLNTMQSDRHFEISLNRLEIQEETENRKLQRLQSEITELESEISDIQNGSYYAMNASEYEYNIKVAEDALKNAGVLFEVGAISRSELKDAENNLENLKLQYEQYLRSEETQYEKYIQSETYQRTEKIKSKREQIDFVMDTLSGIEAEREKLEQDNEISVQNKSYELNGIMFQISNVKMELAILERRLMKVQNPGIVSDYDGVAIEIKAEINQLVNTNDVLMQLIDDSDAFKAEIVLDEEELELISSDSRIEIKVKGMQKVLAGELMSSSVYQDNGGTKRRLSVGIRCSEHELAYREAAVTFITESEKYDVIVPNSAIRKDDKGYFVLTLKEEENVFGKNLRAYRMYVDVIDADNSLSSISGLVFLEKVIVSSTAPVGHGSRVKYEY